MRLRGWADVLHMPRARGARARPWLSQLQPDTARRRTTAQDLALYDRYCLHALMCRHAMFLQNAVAHSSTPGARCFDP